MFEKDCDRSEVKHHNDRKTRIDKEDHAMCLVKLEGNRPLQVATRQND